MADMKPEVVLNWIKAHGVEAAAWVYPKTSDQWGTKFPVFRNGPSGIALTSVGNKAPSLLVPARTWRFISKRIRVTPKSEASMFAVS